MKLFTVPFCLILVVGHFGWGAERGGAFRVLPYVQNPTSDSITIKWLSYENQAGKVRITGDGSDRDFESAPLLAISLKYHPSEPGVTDRLLSLPYIHSVRVSGLVAGKVYQYAVTQSNEVISSSFGPLPEKTQSVRFMVFADSETEPESSTVDPVDWPKPAGSNRPADITKYLVDQTIGFRENLSIIESRKPNFICISGDLVESGGEQRDWDELWSHLAGERGKLASSVPVFPALGNHENYGGPGVFGGYSADAANLAVDKYLTYFDVPSNSAVNPKHRGRYYRIDYGPITLITVDSSDGEPENTVSDTNYNLTGSHAPDFNPGSEQYRWLEAELADAQIRSRFTFVQFHHTPYGSGPHSVPFGREGFSGQSGIAMRSIVPLLMQYGVDAVFCGHDEMLEKSLLEGKERINDTNEKSHSIFFYDAGIGGDGLRGPVLNFDNPSRVFLAHDDAMEVWLGKRLISGGKHYGHLEVNVLPNADGSWSATIDMVHAFPLTNEEGRVKGWERRLYPGSVSLEHSKSPEQ